jgi:hypothetical protein
MENNDLYNKYQAGFRPDHRPTYHIFIIKILVDTSLLKTSCNWPTYAKVTHIYYMWIKLLC